MTDQTPPPTVWPGMRSRNARALIQFIVDAFGFEETAVYGDGDTVHHAQLSWPLGGGVMLGSTRDDPDDAFARQPGTAGVYVVCDDPEALFARATAAGATVVRAPEHTDYGSHEFSVKDPDGNIWSFGTYRGEPRKSQ
jgi:uncharacterized glyoxalase superfamily protein PhnB